MTELHSIGLISQSDKGADTRSYTFTDSLAGSLECLLVGGPIIG